MKKFTIRSGFTMLETLIAIMIFSTVILVVMQVYASVNGIERRAKLERTLMEEGRHTLERIVDVFRGGTVDYAEYWNKRGSADSSCNSGKDLNGNNELDRGEKEQGGIYGNCYRHYAARFYENGSPYTYDTDSDTAVANRHLGSNDTNPASTLEAISDTAEKNLYVINASGNHKTLLRLRNDSGGGCTGADPILVGDKYTGVCHLEMLEMDGFDTDSDGIIDTWDCSEDYRQVERDTEIPEERETDTSDKDNGTLSYKLCVPKDSFIQISPPSLHISKMEFYITPKDDPYKAYNETGMQSQPHATILFSAKINPNYTDGIKGTIAPLELQTTISARAQGEVTLEAK